MTVAREQDLEINRHELKLVEVDNFSAEFVDNTFNVAKISIGTEQFDEAARLRARIYLKSGFIDESSLDDEGREVDSFDVFSSHFGVYKTIEGQSTLVGYTRIVKKELAGYLPVEEHFPSAHVPENSVEASRMMVDDRLESRAEQVIVQMALIRSITVEALKSDSPYVYAILEDHYLKRLNMLGLKFDPVTASELIADYNTNNVAARIDPKTALDGIWKSDQTFSKKGSHIASKKLKFGPLFKEALGALDATGSIEFDARVDLSAKHERNLGFISNKEQQIVSDSAVSIAGCGGDGGAIAIDLARLGVEKFKLADPEVFEVENLNRQASSTLRNIGTNKAESVAKAILDINPYADIQIFTDGVTQENVEEFTQGADLVIDESEFTLPQVGVMIARSSRSRGIPVLMAFNVGFGGYVTSFDPKGTTLERRLGIQESASLEEIAAMEAPGIDRWLGFIPKYVDMKEFAKLGRGEISAPSVVPGVAMASGAGVVEAFHHLVHLKDESSRRPKPRFAPRALSIDAIDGLKEIRMPRVRFAISIGRAALRDLLNLNPKVGDNI